MSTDEESDSVVICSANNIIHQHNDQYFKPSLLLGSDEAGEGIVNAQACHGNEESKDHEVKDCSLGCNVEVSRLHQDDQALHIENLTLDSENLEEKKLNGTMQKTNNMDVESNGRSISKSGNTGTIRQNYTVPQPFALATEKRASGGVRPHIPHVAGSGIRPAASQNMHKKTQLPTTRAKSPKLGRRKSCIETRNPSEGDKSADTFGRLGRHSMGSSKVDIKLQDGVKNATAACTNKPKAKLTKEASMHHPRKVSDQASSDIAVQS